MKQKTAKGACRVHFREGLDTDISLMRYILLHRVKWLPDSVNIPAGSLTSNIISISRSYQYKDTTEHVMICVFTL
jgi:hypothetical protein